MTGLYALKPWYAARLARPRTLLAERGVSPTTVSWAGVCFAATAGGVLATRPAGWVTGAAVAALLALRLACANLDGGLARATGRTSPHGAIVNELSDRAADLVALAGLSTVADPTLVALAALGATLPSWVSLAGASAGFGRLQGGPVGKTERCALLVVAACVGHADAVAAVIAIGGLATAVLRLAKLHTISGGGAR